jgi:hypothetical protein
MGLRLPATLAGGDMATLVKYGGDQIGMRSGAAVSVVGHLDNDPGLRQG